MNRPETLNYRIVGDGYPVLFLHGFLESNSMWSEITPHLRPEIQSILVELPGHGNSPGLSGTPSIKAIAETVRKLMDEISIQQFSIVGHSLGGYVALELLDQMDGFSEKLILLNSHPWEDSVEKKEERNRVIKVVQKNMELFIRTAVPNLYTNPKLQQNNINALINESLLMQPSDIIYALAAMRDRPDRRDIMKKMTKRCKVIQGRHDHMIDASKMSSLTEKYSNAFFMINDAGHMSHHENRKTVIEEINAFI